MINLFDFKTPDDFRASLAQYFPGGRIFQSKDDSSTNTYKFIAGLAEELFRANQILRGFNSDYYPNNTTQLLEEWEQTLGIPDSCFSVEDSTLIERQRNVIVKLAGMSIQTAGEFEALAAEFGLAVTVVGGLDPSVSPVITPDKTARFTIVVQYIADTSSTFTLTFPFQFGNDVIALMECVFNRIRPANCNVRFDAV